METLINFMAPEFELFVILISMSRWIDPKFEDPLTLQILLNSYETSSTTTRLMFCMRLDATKAWSRLTLTGQNLFSFREFESQGMARAFIQSKT